MTHRCVGRVENQRAPSQPLAIGFGEGASALNGQVLMMEAGQIDPILQVTRAPRILVELSFKTQKPMEGT